MSEKSVKSQKERPGSSGAGACLRENLSRKLRACGISSTPQRLSIAQELLVEKVHLCAEDVARRVNLQDRNVSRATVYNTLRRFVDCGLVRQVSVGSDRIFYDSNPEPHHHIYDPESGGLTDIDSRQVKVIGLPELPRDRELDSIELVIRLKATKKD